MAPLTEPELAGFVAALDPVNALADAAGGLVWRLPNEDGDATAIRGFGDDRLIVNMTVWTSMEALAAFVHTGAHREILARRREWFVATGEMWWVPEGHRPTVTEAEQRLDHLREHGSSERAFTFRRPFGAPPVDDDLFCRV